MLDVSALVMAFIFSGGVIYFTATLIQSLRSA